METINKSLLPAYKSEMKFFFFRSNSFFFKLLQQRLYHAKNEKKKLGIFPYNYKYTLMLKSMMLQKYDWFTTFSSGFQPL